MWRQCLVTLAVVLFCGASGYCRDKASQTVLSDRLVLASSNDDLPQVKRLLSQGADPNAIRSSDGLTPLGAVVLGQEHVTPVMRYLIAHGAKPNVHGKAWDGLTPLMIAIGSIEDTETIGFLLSHGAKINERDNSGWTALHHATCICGGCGCMTNGAIGSYLIQQGADVNSRNSNGDTPLMLLVETAYYSADTVRLARNLIRRGTDLNHKNKAGKTALQLAKEVGWPEIVQLLKQSAAIKRR